MSGLEKFTEEQLQTELSRRKNKDWYFFEAEEPGYNGCKNFNIVHRRFWHLNHEVPDFHVNDFILLPKGFGEEQESVFEYSGKQDEAESILKENGFVKLKSPYLEGYIVYVPVLNVGWPRLDIRCDSPNVREETQKWIDSNLPKRSKKLPREWNKENVMGQLLSFVRLKEFIYLEQRVYGEKGKIWNGSGITILEKKVFESLPQYTKELEFMGK